MARSMQLALLLGILLVAAPVSLKAQGDEYEDGDEAPAGATGAPIDLDSNVLVGTEANFDQLIAKHTFVLAEFYAPWCGHCKNLAPQYAKAATELRNTHKADVVLVKIDATVETALGQKYKVQGYPTLKWFVGGEPQDYAGPRESDGIVSWIKKRTGPPTVNVETAEALATIEAENAVIVVGYFKELKGADYEAFKKIGGIIEDVTFVDTIDKTVAKAAGLTALGVVVIKNFKGEPRAVSPFTGAIDSGSDAFKTFVQGEKIPLIIEFNQENGDKIFQSGIKWQLLLWGTPEELTPGSAVFDAFKAVASQLKGKLVFVTVDNSGAAHEPVTNFFGLKDAPSPAVVGFYMEKNRKYKLRTELTEANIVAFAESVVNGTAEPDFKSAPIPDEDDATENSVTVVVGKTVESIVFDETKDVLLEIYAPWCGHCKQLEPVYSKLAKRFAKVDSMVIAKMDGTENEHPDLVIQGFPTIFFVPAGTRKFIEYKDEARGVKDFTKWLKQHAKVPYVLPKKGGAGQEGKDEL